MPTMQDLQDELDELNTRFPRPDLTLKMGSIYNLRTQYKETFPASEQPGVYGLIAEDAVEVLRIGKAKCLGKRLGNYFKYEDRQLGRGRAKQTVYDGVHYIVTIPLPLGRAFEVHSIEAFLLSKMRPRLNSIFELEAYEDVVAEL